MLTPEPNLGEDDEDKDLEPGPSGTSKASAQISGQSDTDITAEFLQPLLTPDNVANLVRMGEECFPPGWEGRISSVFLLPPLHTVYLLQSSLLIYKAKGFNWLTVLQAIQEVWCWHLLSFWRNLRKPPIIVKNEEGAGISCGRAGVRERES